MEIHLLGMGPENVKMAPTTCAVQVDGRREMAAVMGILLLNTGAENVKMGPIMSALMVNG